MEHVLVAVLKASELVVELCSTAYERVRSDGETGDDEPESSSNGDGP